VTEPIKLKEGYTVIRLEEVRYPENPKQRAEAEALSLTRQQGEAVRTAYAALTKKHVTKFDKALVAKLNLHVSPPRYKALTKDKRVLVAIKGEAPITVGDLANEIAGEFFHGLDQAIKEKRINAKKRLVLDTLAFKRLFDKEARERKIDQSFLFELTVADHANSLLFGAFLDKAIVPGVMVKDEEVQAYYEEKKSEYSTSAFYTLDSIGFPTTAKAQAALDRLNAGTDFKWLKQNAPDQLAEEERDQALEGRTIMATSMPEALKKVVAGAKAGDYRLYVSPSGAAYALQVAGHVPAQTRPLEQVREPITKKIFSQNIGKAVKEYSAKLRESYEVEVFITRIGR
jgi:hypothetical protein